MSCAPQVRVECVYCGRWIYTQGGKLRMHFIALGQPQPMLCAGSELRPDDRTWMPQAQPDNETGGKPAPAQPAEEET